MGTRGTGFEWAVFSLTGFFGLVLSTLVQAADLLILTWEYYIDPDVVTEFEQTHDTRLRFIYYEDDNDRDAILAHTGGTGFDLIVFDEIMAKPYGNSGWLEPIKTLELPNLRHVVDPRTRQPLPAEVVSVPYAWGSIGLVYRSDLVTPAPTSWMDFFRPRETLKGRLLAINTPSTTYRMAFKALGHSLHTTDPAHIRQAAELLQAQRPYVREYRNVLFGEASSLLSGEVWMAMTYNGDALYLMREQPNLAFIYPSEGSMIWIDSMAILQSAQQKALAREFINFIHEPAINARNAVYIQYATPNRAATSLLPAEFRNNELIYPPVEQSGRFEADTLLPSTLMQEINNRFIELIP